MLWSQKFTPRASTPSSARRSASPAVVIPQILRAGTTGSRKLLRSSDTALINRQYAKDAKDFFRGRGEPGRRQEGLAARGGRRGL